MFSGCAGGLLPRNSSSSSESRRRGGIGGMGDENGCTVLTLGWTETGRKGGISTSGFMPDEPGRTDSVGLAVSVDRERKYWGRGWPKEFAITRGGSRLTLFPPRALSSSCFASSRLCAAKASSGDSSGGISPAICSLGDGRLLNDGDGRGFPYCS
jgi:hypothetical protein